MIETDRGVPKYYFRNGIDDVVEWTREQLDSYLQVEWETHLAERLVSGNADDVIVRVLVAGIRTVPLSLSLSRSVRYGEDDIIRSISLAFTAHVREVTSSMT